MTESSLATARDAVLQAAGPVAANVLGFARTCPPDASIAPGGMLAGALAKVIECPAELACVIELMADCVAQLAAHQVDRLS